MPIAREDRQAAAARDTGPALGRRLMRLASRMHRLQIERLARLSTPLSIRQFRILDRVDLGITSLGKLAELARRRPSTISKSADSLVRQHLITRTEDAGDRRAMVLRLTPAGAALLEEARQAVGELADWLVGASGMEPSRLAAFVDELYEQTEQTMDRLRAALPEPPGSDPYDTAPDDTAPDDTACDDTASADTASADTASADTASADTASDHTADE